MNHAIEVRGLTKSFGRTRALDGLELTIRSGEVHGFLGPNGAGKSTTLRILLGLMRADGGSATLLGGDPWSDAPLLHRRVAYVPGDVALWPGLSGGETLDLIARLQGGTDPKRRAALVARFDLDLRKKGRTYSKGNRQKVALVAALASTAELLIFDEPTSGLDPLMERTFQECVAEVKTEGRTVLLSSHILAEAEALCDRISIVRAGRTVETGTLSELRALTHSTLVAELAAPVPDLSSVPGVDNVTWEGTHLRCDVSASAFDALMPKLAGAGVRSLRVEPATLESLFLRHYRADAGSRS